MSEVKDDKIIGVRVHISECEHGRPFISDVEVVRESAVIYDAGSTTVGWSSAYDANWERTFGSKAPEEPKADDLN